MGKSTKKIYDLEYTDAFDSKMTRNAAHARRFVKHQNSRAIRRWNKKVINEEMDAMYAEDYTWQSFNNYIESPEFAYERKELDADYNSSVAMLGTDMSVYAIEHTQSLPEFKLPTRIIPMHSHTECNDGLCKDWEVSAAIACMILLIMLTAII